MTDFERSLRTALRDTADRVRVAPDAWQRNEQLVRQGASTGIVGGQVRGSTGRSRWRIPALAAALVAILAIGVAIAFRFDDNSDVATPAPETRLAPLLIGGTTSGCPRGSPDLKVAGLEILDQQDNASYSVFRDQPSAAHPTVCVTTPRLTDAVALSQTPDAPLTLVVHRGPTPYLWGVLGRSAKELRLTVDGQPYRYWGTIYDDHPAGAVSLGGGWDTGTGFAGGLPPAARSVTVQAIDRAGRVLQTVRIDLSAGTVGSGPQQAQSTALTCPALLGPDGPGGLWVPSAPADQPDRLVPDEVPVRALACRYHHDNTADGRAGSGPIATRLGGDLRPMIDDIRWWPMVLPHQAQVCSDVAVSQSDNILLGLTYRSGDIIWIAARDPGSCNPIGNGVDRTDVDRSGQLLASATAGRWLPTTEWVAGCPKEVNCDGWTEGRWGQQVQMVPDRPTEVTVSRSTMNDQQHPVTNSAPAGADLVDAFNELRTTGVETGTCTPNNADGTLYSVRFSYASGPAVMIRINVGCLPSVSNGSLTAVSEGSVTPLLDTILAG